MHAFIIGDYRHTGIERVCFLVQRLDRLLVHRTAGDNRTAQLRQIIGVRWPAESEHQVIGDVHNARDRALACGDQTALHPFRRSAIRNTAYHAAIEGRAAFWIFSTDLDRTGEAGFDIGRLNRLECAEARCRQIAGNALHAHTIRAVGRDRHIEHRTSVVIICKGLANRRIGGQLNNPVMLVAQLQLAYAAHHTVRFHPANSALAKLHSVRRHDGAGQAQNALHSGARIGRTAYNLQRLPVSGIDTEDLQLVRIGMLASGQDFGNAKAFQPHGRVVNSLYLVTDLVECGGNFFDTGIGFEEVFQPFERELHARAPTPAERVGWSNALKP